MRDAFEEMSRYVGVWAKAEEDHQARCYKRKRYEDGCYQVKELAKQRCAIVDLPGPGKMRRARPKC